MKKSFMTRVLATGLSLAMAFSLSAATNVSVASAAAKPAMKSSKMTVKVGQKKNYQATAATQKAYKITKVKMSAAGKTKAKVTVNSSKKSIKVEGLAATKGSNVVISFKNNKTKKTTTVTTKVVVKAVDEKLTMTAAATKVKQITVTFNKAVDDATTKITVKKSSATPTVSEIKFDDAKKVATLAMAGKLTKGTYTVTAVVGDETLTADVVVEKDETLTTFKLVGNTLKAASATNTTKASIEYQALNQYEEPMSGANPTVTIAPGTTKTSECKVPTKDKNGVAVVDDIPATYAIPGMEFTVLIVDSTGKTLQDKAVYGSYAKAAKATSAGLYNTKKAKFMDMTAGDEVSDYVALFTLEDQYSDPYEAKDYDANTGGISAVALGGVTNVKAKAFTYTPGKAPIKEVGGKKYLCVELTNLGTNTKAIAGDFTLSMVNGQYGQMGEFPYTVLPNTEIKSLSISKDMIYAGQKNEMEYTALDTNGNEITKYDVLKKVDFGTKGSANGTMKFEKNADGTAKLVYNVASGAVPAGVKTSIETFTATANEPVSSNYFVQTYSFTVSEKRYATAVVGINSKIAKSTAVSKSAIDLDFKKLLIEDQYGNLFTEAELYDGTLVPATAVVVSGAPLEASDTTTSPGAWIVSGADISTIATGAAFKNTKTKIQLVSAATPGAVSTDFKFYVIKDGKLNTDPYKLTMKKVNESDKKKISNIEIDSIADGKVVASYPNATLSASIVSKAAKASSSGAVGTPLAGGTVTVPVVVSAKVGEDKIILDSSTVDAYISCAPIKPWSSINDNQTETATLTVKVATDDGTVTLTKEFQVSNMPGTVAKIALKDGYDGTEAGNEKNTSPSAVKIADIVEIEATNQYGYAASLGKDALYTISVTEVTSGGAVITSTAKDGTEYTLTNADGMNTASIKVNYTSVVVTAKITVTVGDKTISFDQKFNNQ